jgi:hypothetical protein
MDDDHIVAVALDAKGLGPSCSRGLSTRLATARRPIETHAESRVRELPQTSPIRRSACSDPTLWTRVHLVRIMARSRRSVNLNEASHQGVLVPADRRVA